MGMLLRRKLKSNVTTASDLGAKKEEVVDKATQAKKPFAKKAKKVEE